MSNDNQFCSLATLQFSIHNILENRYNSCKDDSVLLLWEKKTAQVHSAVL